MKLSDCINRIEKYLNAETGEILLVDVPNDSVKTTLLSHFNVGRNRVVKASDYCKKDEFPSVDAVYDEMRETEGNIFVTELSSFLKLYGEQELRQQLKSILGMQIKGCVIVVTFQCAKYLETKDPRVRRRIMRVDGEESKKPKLYFVSSDLKFDKQDIDAYGLQGIAEEVESGNSVIQVETMKNKDSFSSALYEIVDVNRPYEILCQRDPKTRQLDENLGDKEKWAFVLDKIPKGNKWEDAVSSTFGNYSNLEFAMHDYKTFDSNRRWFYYVALRLFGAKTNWCLAYAAEQAGNNESLVRMAYRGILDVGPVDKDFWNKYESRKSVLEAFGNPKDEAIDFCKMIRAKGKDAIYYLTDNTDIEKQEFFYILDKYGEEYEKEELEDVLEHTFPALYDYLSPYHFEVDLLNDYFQGYKYQKVINRVLPEFEKQVDEQAEKREFNLLLPPRSSVVDSIVKANSQLFFMDAMGVEYLGYIMKRIQDRGLKAKVTVCRCNLPTITSCNKEFVEAFKKENIPVSDIKDLDELKHDGEQEFDYSKTKLPIHLIYELEIIDKLIENIDVKLSRGDIQKAVVISDHGASRLAVIKEEDLTIDVNSAGTHGGRLCEYTDEIKEIPHAVHEDDYYILASYARFKGGRKPSVETHGGATLEEVTVPIIEIVRETEDYEIVVMSRIISVSYKKKAALELFSKTKIDDLKVCVNGEFFEAKAIDDNNYLVEMPGLKKAGKYEADAYSGDNLIVSKLEFEVRKESSAERDLFA